MNIELNLLPPDGPIKHPYSDFVNNEDFMEMAFMGGYNTAKTTAMVDAAILTGINYPGAEILIARKHGTDLRGSTLVTLEQRGGILFSAAGGSKNKNLMEYVFPPAADPMNPGRTVQSIIRGLGLDTADLDDKMRSRQPFRVFLEEGNQMVPAAHNTSLLRCRQMVYHRVLKNRHRVQKLSEKWGLPFRQVQAYMGLSDDDLEKPMQGLVGVKTIFNPDGNDHLWKRYVGVPYPEDGPTVEWVKENMGIREEHIPPDEHQDPNRRYKFRADDTVLYQGHRRTVGHHRPDGVLLIPKGDLPEALARPKELTLIMQRAARYAWPWMNESGNKDNHAASFLIPDKDMAKKFFAGRIDVKSGLVYPQFDPTPGKGHVIPAPSNDMLRNHRAIGAVDHGGNHATAAVILAVTWDDRLVAVREYVQAGQSATQNAYHVKGIVPPELDVDWYCDPSMQRKAYETDAMSSAIDSYGEAQLYLQPAPAKGDEAVDIVKNMLVFKQDMVRGYAKSAELYVSDACPNLIRALSELTWRDLSMRRDKWEVDLADALKYACSAKYATRTGKAEVGVVRAGPQVARWRDPHAAQRPPFRARV
jgi:hypothetical protein